MEPQVQIEGVDQICDQGGVVDVVVLEAAEVVQVGAGRLLVDGRRRQEGLRRQGGQKGQEGFQGQVGGGARQEGGGGAGAAGAPAEAEEGGAAAETQQPVQGWVAAFSMVFSTQRNILL